MGVLPLLLLGLLLLQVHAAPNDNAMDIGNSNWGWNLVVSHPPRECAPLQLWYNLSNPATQPEWTTLPADGAVEFLTPDSAEDVWMTLRPPMGQGTLSWSVVLREGKQFVVRNSQGYKQVFTVGSATDTTSCSQDATQVTGTSSYGELKMAVFNRLRSQSFSSYSVSPADQFRPTGFPSNTGTVRNVPLGAAIPVDTTAPESPATDDDKDDDKDSVSSNPEETSTPADHVTTSNGPAVTRTTSNGLVGTTPIAQGPSNSETDVSPSNGVSEDPAGNTSSGDTTKGNDSLPRESASSGSGSGSGTNIGAIVGAVVGALLAGFLIGAFCVWLHRRRRRRRRMAAPLEVSPIPAMAETTESIAATGGAFSGLAGFGVAAYASDRKNPALFEDMAEGSNRDSMAATTAMWTDGSQSYFGGQSDYPATTERALSEAGTLVAPRPAAPPPKYSQYA